MHSSIHPYVSAVLVSAPVSVLVLMLVPASALVLVSVINNNANDNNNTTKMITTILLTLLTALLIIAYTPGLHNKIPPHKIFARVWVAQEPIFV